MAAGQVSSVGFTSPGYDYSADLAEIARQQKMADMLQQQSMQPIDASRSAGGWVIPVSPWEGAAKLAQGAASGIQAARARQMQKELAAKSQSDYDLMVRKGMGQMLGRPATPLSEDASGNVTAPQPAGAPDPYGALATFGSHPMGAQFAPLAMQEIQRQALTKQLSEMFPQQGGGGAAPSGVSPQTAAGVGAPWAAGAPAAPQSVGINPADPRLLALSMSPGGGPLATMISNREIAGDRSRVDWAKLQQSQFEFSNLSAAQKADLASKGIHDAIAYAKAKDEGINLAGVPVPGSLQVPPAAPAAPAPAAPTPAPSARPANFPMETPEAREQARTRQREILQKELAEEQAKPPSPERDANIAALDKEMKNLGGAAPLPAGSPKGQREAADAAARAEAIKRAEAGVERTVAQPAEEMKLQSARRKAAIVSNRVDKALEQTGFWTTGLTGRAGALVTGPAYDLGKTIETVKANLGFSELQAMRDSSPTGGALGQVAVRELDFLQAAVASLDQGQNPQQLKDNLLAVKRHFEGWKTAVEDAYKQKYGKVPAAPTDQPLSASEQQELQQLLKRFEKK